VVNGYKKDANGMVTYYHYDPRGKLIAETDGSGSPLRDYIYLGDEPVAVKVHGAQAGIYYYINDHLGTPQRLIDSAGQVVWRADYDPFGQAAVDPASTVENSLRFPGQYFDEETGLHYNWHRYYDPQTGRYLTPDPIGLEGGINLYLYVQNNPINFIDPTGLVCGTWWNDWAINDKPAGNDFSSCCKEHDDCYDECGKTKEECDNAFYNCMSRKCAENMGGKQCYDKANQYWWSVDRFGKGAYDKAQKTPYKIMTEDDY
jgi:RHS repeat-associated protein